MEDTLKVSQSVTPFYDHQQPTAGALNRYSQFLFDMGRKLSVNGTEAQKMKFKQLSADYVTIRGAVAQSFIYELEIHELRQRLIKQQAENLELKKENEKLIKEISELPDWVSPDQK
jgi:hypothetical protein